jgi:hypothetical protein
MDTEVKAPLVLLGGSLLVFAALSFAGSGAEGAGALLGAVALSLVIDVVLGIIGLYLAAAVLGIDFGNLGTAVLKLAAILCAPIAVATLIPVPLVALISAIVLYWWLLSWLFELSGRDLVISVVILFLVRLAGNLALMAMLPRTTG